MEVYTPRKTISGKHKKSIKVIHCHSLWTWYLNTLSKFVYNSIFFRFYRHRETISSCNRRRNYCWRNWSGCSHSSGCCFSQISHFTAHDEQKQGQRHVQWHHPRWANESKKYLQSRRWHGGEECRESKLLAQTLSLKSEAHRIFLTTSHFQVLTCDNTNQFAPNFYCKRRFSTQCSFFSYLRHLRREMSITLVLTFYLGSAYLPFVRDKIFLTTNVYPLS